MTPEITGLHSRIEQQAHEGRPHWFQLSISNDPNEIGRGHQQVMLGIGKELIIFQNQADPNSANLDVKSTAGQFSELRMVKGQEERFGDIVISLQEIRADSSAYMIFSPNPIRFPAVQSK